MAKKLNPWYVTGLFDGDGCFSVYSRRLGKTCNEFDTWFELGMRAGITLRDDHEDLVLRIMKYFKNHGSINRTCSKGNPGNPCANYQIRAKQDLLKIIIPHFDKYPPQSRKKLKEYKIWRKIVILAIRRQAGEPYPPALRKKISKQIRELKKYRAY